MKLTLTDADTQPILSALEASNKVHSDFYPGDSSDRQPVHTVYGGANLFKAGSAQKLGSLALRNLEAHAPNFVSLAKIVGLTGAESLPSSSFEIAALAKACQEDEAGMKERNPAACTPVSVSVAQTLARASESFFASPHTHGRRRARGAARGRRS